jgi:hypothetical protein
LLVSHSSGRPIARIPLTKQGLLEILQEAIDLISDTNNNFVGDDDALFEAR